MEPYLGRDMLLLGDFPRPAVRGSSEAIPRYGSAPQTTRCSHARPCVAPLKPSALSDDRVAETAFPRTAVRGSIEAEVSRRAALRLETFPRTAVRGSIE